MEIRSSLASNYTRKFERVGDWIVLKDGNTEGGPLNNVLLSKSRISYQRKKKTVGFKRALPFRCPYMAKLWVFTETFLEESYTSAMLWKQHRFDFYYGLELMSW